MDKQDIRDTLDIARELIARGWIKGTAHQRLDGGKDVFCLSGAISYATGWRPGRAGQPSTLCAGVHTYVAQRIPIPGVSIASWNDAYVSHQDVLDFLDRLIMELDVELTRNAEPVIDPDLESDLPIDDIIADGIDAIDVDSRERELVCA